MNKHSNSTRNKTCLTIGQQPPCRAGIVFKTPIRSVYRTSLETYWTFIINFCIQIDEKAIRVYTDVKSCDVFEHDDFMIKVDMNKCFVNVADDKYIF